MHHIQHAEEGAEPNQTGEQGGKQCKGKLYGQDRNAGREEGGREDAHATTLHSICVTRPGTAGPEAMSLELLLMAPPLLLPTGEEEGGR